MIIDIHTHVWAGAYEANKASLLKAIDRFGLAKIYVSGLKSYQSDEEEIDLLNKMVYDFMREEPEKVGGAV